METRFVPDTPHAWVVYELETLILALPADLRAAGDAIAAHASPGLSSALVALEASGIASEAPFAMLEHVPEGLRVALRGPATVTAGAVNVTGLGALTPIERLVPRAADVRLTVPGGEWRWSIGTPTSAPVSLPESSEVTEIPEVEYSLPVLPPPPLGVHPVDLGAASFGASRPAGDAVPRMPPYPSAQAQHASPVSTADGDAIDDGDRTVVIDDIATRRADHPAPPGSLRPQSSTPAQGRPNEPTPDLELPDGSRQPLDAVVLLGRAPSAAVGGPPSRIVRLTGDGDISRNHARVELEGGTVVVTDMGSRNGTIVRIPGRPAKKLREGEPTPVSIDTVIDFGGGIEVSVREG